MSQEITIQTPFLKLMAKTWGDKNQKPLLAIHGWMDNAASFDFIAPLLTSKYYIVAVDLPGHGKSQHRDITASYAFVNWVLDVVACAESLGWDKYSILGHSMGASIACLTAAAVPDNVEEIFLIEGLGPITDAPDRCIPTLRRHIRENLASVKRKTPIYESRELLIQKRMEINNISKEAASALVNRATLDMEEGVSWSADPRVKMTSPIRFMEEQVLSIFEEIACPVMLFRADKGISYNKEKIEKRCQKIKGLKIVDVTGSHHVHMDNPQPIADSIIGV